MQNLARFYIDIPALRPGTVGAYLLASLSDEVALKITGGRKKSATTTNKKAA
jgi:hypothetical protein